MTLVNIFIEPHLSCSKLSYSLREDWLLQAINLVYKFFNPFISNGDLIVALISFSRSKHAVTFKNSYFSCVGAFLYGDVFKCFFPSRQNYSASPENLKILII